MEFGNLIWSTSFLSLFTKKGIVVINHGFIITTNLFFLPFNLGIEFECKNQKLITNVFQLCSMPAAASPRDKFVGPGDPT